MGIVGATLGLVSALFLAAEIRDSQSALNVPSGTFGSSMPESDRATELLVLAQYAEQQKRSFALLWVSVAIGLVFGTVLVGRTVFARELDLATLANTLGLAGDIWLGTYAKSIYKDSSERLERLLDKVTRSLMQNNE